MDRPDATDEPSPASPLSRLSAAFARMLGSPARAPEADAATPAPEPSPDAGEKPVHPEGIIEARLFVGRPDGAAHSAEELAAGMRGVSADDAAAAVDELNRRYQADGAPYRIAAGAGGYRLRLDPSYAALRTRFSRTARPARLSQPVLEVLSVVAYRQPIGGPEVDALRGKRSAAALAQLVRRELVRRDAAADDDGEPTYRTTDRFLRLFDLAGAEQLPRVAEFDD